jgi:hypothetical protein
MRGGRLEKTGSVFAEYVEDFLRAENDADAGRSFVAAERHYSDRLLVQVYYSLTQVMNKGDI